MNPESRISFLLMQKDGTGRVPLVITEERGLSPLSLLKTMLELQSHTFSSPVSVLLMRQAVMVISSMETGKLRHSSFSKTPIKETDGEGFF